VIEFGSVILINDVHPEKHPLPIDVIEFGSVILVNDVHP
jgi:hypothetical protein